MPSRDAQRLAANLLAASRSGGVGGVNIRPQYVGGVEVAPQYVGAPAQLVQSLGTGAVPYSPEMYSAADVSYMGLGATPILAGAVGQLVAITPVRPFKPQKLLLASTVIGLLIVSISVGGIDLLAGPGVPVEIFSEVSTSPQLNWPTLDPAVGVVFAVANPTGGNLNFTGALYGTAVRR